MSDLITDFVRPDEPCHGLFEGILMRAGQWRWCQVVRVVRDDEMAEYLKDFGPAENFEMVTPMMMPSFGENTVAQLQDYAAKNRQDTYWRERARQIQAESTLIQDHIEQAFKIEAILHNRSTFGPTGHTQRNGYSRRKVPIRG